MDSHSIFNYRTLFSALSSIFLFFSVLSFSSADICARCTKKQDLPRRQALFFRKFPSQLRYSRSRSRTIRT